MFATSLILNLGLFCNNKRCKLQNIIYFQQITDKFMNPVHFL